MPSPYSERMPNGMDATLALLPDRWKKLLLAKEQDGPEVDQRLIRPAWSGNDNPVELSAPQVTTGSLVSGRDPGEMVVARGYVSQRPRPLQSDTPQPVVDTTYRPPQPDELPAQTTPIAPPSIQRNLPDTRSVNEPIAPPSIQGNAPDTSVAAPLVAPRNFSQYVLAPDQTKNPDYAGQDMPSQSGEQTTRPAWSDPYDKAVSRDLAIRDALANPSTLPKAQGWKRLLPIAVRAAQGIAATGSIGGGLGGAIEGGIETAVDPRSATKIAYQRKLGQADQNLSGMQAIRGAQIKQQGELADIGYKRAQTADILDRPIRERIKTTADIEKDNRTRTEVERHNKVMEGLQGTSRADSQKRFEETQRHNKAMEDIGRGRTEATGYGQDIMAENENAALQASQQNEQAQREWQNKHDSWTQTKADVAEFNALVGQREAAQRQLQALANQELKLKKDGYSLSDAQEIQAQEAQSKIADIGAQLEAKRPLMSGDYAELDSNGRFKLKPEPSRSSPVNRAPVRSRRMPAQATAPPISEDAFVEAARQKMGRSFDEAKARAAWQKKYGGH